jgi:hypothetical protein
VKLAIGLGSSGGLATPLLAKPPATPPSAASLTAAFPFPSVTFAALVVAKPWGSRSAFFLTAASPPHGEHAFSDGIARASLVMLRFALSLFLRSATCDMTLPTLAYLCQYAHTYNTDSISLHFFRLLAILPFFR